jgi:6-phosphogluconolactonase
MRNQVRTLLVVVLAIGAALSARGNAQNNVENDESVGAVFVMTNAAARNQIIAYKRSADGSLSESHTFSTGGRGSGGSSDPLESQGSLTLTEDHSLLLAVNAGSGEISVFRVHGASLTLVDRVPCGGSEPVAVAEHRNLVYVVNAGGNSNVVGFRFDEGGRLKPIARSIAFLSTSDSGPGSVSFSPDGQFLLVTEKLTNSVDVFAVHSDGTLGPMVVNPSAGPGAFAALFAPNGTALVSETGPSAGHNASAISSYAVRSNGKLSTISASVPTLGAATCWLVVTPDGRFVYTDNAGTANVSGFSIGSNGALTAIGETVLGTLPTGSTNLDMAISSDGKFLYTLDSGTGTVGIFSINSNGTLNSLGEVDGLPATVGFNGIAAI